MSASAKLSRMVCLLCGFFSTGISMASSLILLSASDLAGQWTLQQDE
ncbi:alkaline proteinase inhibitor AprI, partial [Pseudomonas aeruginosa]|nr:alkaline proteinase inhibitor AprI [Pseudomonas aeruginosa]